jgi:hypothetical protein
MSHPKTKMLYAKPVTFTLLGTLPVVIIHYGLSGSALQNALYIEPYNY